MIVKAHALVSAKAASLVAVVALGMAQGCNEPNPPHEPWTANDLNSEKQDKMKANPREHWNHMADNATLSDMAIADFHFIPHTGELSGTGAEKLSRMGPFLDTYGGTVRYDTRLTDEKLIEQRLAHVREYLETIGTDMSRVEVATKMSGGQMLAAGTAIKIDDKGTAQPSSGGGSPIVIGPSPNP
jgi:hypothetical protein